MRQPKQFRDTLGTQLIEETYEVRLVFFDPKTNIVHNDSYPEYDPWWAINVLRYGEPHQHRGNTYSRSNRWILFNGDSFYTIRLWEDGLYHLSRSSGRLWRLTVLDKERLQQAVAEYLEEQLGAPDYHTKIVCSV